ncbi:tyrosine-type recombinase/integrase [Pontibacillus sp. HMF3514]|uniref:tyrosine-type recombinase/integrase n=1 Tax=Pontibacillus sp. HMF3514 TaxID=2692425 RepID=UPI00132026B0|nr:tyrosine-type recombinase/integrase [Pontibacillus sp. HMF3514]QHE52415.1 tyrosine-type recombinase/integrase [Pontibacillus sp. HMF3514]
MSEIVQPIIQQDNEINWFSKDTYLSIVQQGFRNVDWSRASDELLLYLFLHDEPSIGTKRKKSTLKEYFREVNQFFTYIHQWYESVREIHPELVTQYQLEIEQRGYKSTTLRRKSTVVQQFLQFLYKYGMVEEDLTKSMKRISLQKDQLVNRDFYEEEVQALLQYFKKHDWYMYTLLFTLVSTGLRIQELCSARWSSITYQPEANLYFVSVVGKRDKLREVPLFNEVLEVLQEFRMRRGFSGELNGQNTPLFPKPNGDHYNFKYLSNEFTKQIENLQDQFPFIKRRIEMEKQFADSGKSVRFRITPHTCRHYTAAYYLSKGADLKAIQDLLDHESSVTTDQYLRRTRKFSEHAAVKIGGSFMGAQ